MDENGVQPAMRSAFQALPVDNIEESDRSARQRAADVDYSPEYERPPARRPAAERADAFSLGDWLFDGATGLVDEVLHHDLWLPEEFWVHAYAAQREGKMALDIAIDTLRRRARARRQQEIERAQRLERRGDINIEF